MRSRSHEAQLRQGLRDATVEGGLVDSGNLLEIQDLQTVFDTDDGIVRAVDGIDLSVQRGSTTCIVGESGSGKSATARSIVQVVDEPGRVAGGRILYQAKPTDAAVDLAAMEQGAAAIRSIRGKEIGLIFQEPMSSLSPVHTIGNQITELLTLHDGLGAADARERVVEELRLVGIPRPEERIDAYTFQLSGGMRQRAMIAMALVCRPSLLIADEPTTALDVTTQAQILDLLAELKASLGMTMLFITHDLGVVAEIADHVVVMRHGKVVETGPVEQIFHDPQHDYTRELLASLPQGHTTGSAKLQRLTPRAAGSPGMPTARSLLQIKDLTMRFTGHSGGFFSRKKRETINAVDGVSVDVPEGTTLGLVGESGCGKTTLGRCVLRAYRPTSGEILYGTDGNEPVDLAPLREKELFPYRQQIRMVFQDPYGSLNPRMTVQQVIAEPLRAAGVEAAEIRERVAEMLDRVGLRPAMAGRYPHAFSGGERQRIGIARALITRPRLVVADEAVSALDVSVRTQILGLLSELQEELGLTYLFISHDLSVVEQVCDRVAVMYFGRIVEQGTASDIFVDPRHGYTKALLSAVPVSDPRQRGERERVIYRPEEAS